MQTAHPVAPSLQGPVRALSQGQADGLIAALTLGLAATALLPRMRESPTLMGSILAAAAVVAFLLLTVRKSTSTRPLSLQRHIRRPHWVQAIMHSSIFIYWGMYVELVGHEAWLFLPQILFAYGLDLYFGWKNHGNWRLGFGPLPIIGSTNLFLWFKDDWYYLQFLMVALVFFSREYIKWRRADRKTHIFNPSAFGLTALSIPLILTHNADITYGVEIATTLGWAPGMFFWIFGTGLIVQFLFGTALVTMSAALAAFAIDAAYFQSTGNWFFIDSAIPIAVFLGMNLLITDPVTSPRSKMGKLLFGAGYGALVFPLLTGLEAIDNPSYFDKLLAVPVLNLMAPLLDKLGALITGLVPKGLRLEGVSQKAMDNAFVVIWALAFALLHPRLTDHPGGHPSYWMEMCTEEGKDFACRNLRLLADQECDLSRVEGCLYVARMYREGLGVPPNLTHAAGYAGRACELGNAVACMELAVAFRDGLGLSPDASKARALLGKACRADHGPACYTLGQMLMAGQGGPPDAAGAAKALSSACAKDAGPPCNELGFLLQSGGPGLPPDLPQAASSFAKACDEGELAEGCMNAAAAWVTGRGVAQDAPKGVRYFAKACELKLAPGCVNAGAMLATGGQGVAPDLDRALTLNRAACELGNGVGCTRTGTMYGRGMGVPVDAAEARRWYERGCEAGDQAGCGALGPSKAP